MSQNPAFYEDFWFEHSEPQEEEQEAPPDMRRLWQINIPTDLHKHMRYTGRAGFISNEKLLGEFPELETWKFQRRKCEQEGDEPFVVNYEFFMQGCDNKVELCGGWDPEKGATRNVLGALRLRNKTREKEVENMAKAEATKNKEKAPGGNYKKRKRVGDEGGSKRVQKYDTLP
ncbi:hypothetical protein BU23DRAFT_572767 [Bimuria novae-zelandiae CBS 107.79]|uniref:Uncharacterized protein n=1 Tax=Bimuria novae-zelandiae CBS 107.79 TaxID=1447943 RepID=A0A6A5UYK5_9PLEO|nr:hypothetical protein BU23DRAFT_572767 [Bimuria novae-zelandiae CBS 107.79]